jgi:hypothetical protein
MSSPPTPATVKTVFRIGEGMLTFISGKQKPLVVHGKNILAHKSLRVF